MRNLTCIFFLIFFVTVTALGQSIVEFKKDGRIFSKYLNDSVDVFLGEVYNIDESVFATSSINGSLFTRLDSTKRRKVNFTQKLIGDSLQISNIDSTSHLLISKKNTLLQKLDAGKSKMIAIKNVKYLRLEQESLVTFIKLNKEKNTAINILTNSENKSVEPISPSSNDPNNNSLWAIILAVLGLLGTGVFAYLFSREKRKCQNIKNENTKIQLKILALETELNTLKAKIPKEEKKRKTKQTKAKIKVTEKKAPASLPTPKPEPEITTVELKNHRKITQGISTFIQETETVQHQINDFLVKDQFIKQFLSIISEMFVKKEEATQTETFDEWTTILTGLEKNNLLIDPEYVKAIKDFRNEKDQIQYLEKPLYLGYLHPAIESIFILTEELHKLKFFVMQNKVENFSKFAAWEGFIESKITHLKKTLATQLNLKVHTVEILHPLLDYAEFTQATDKKKHRLYFDTINRLAQQRNEPTIVEILSLSTSSTYNNSKTLVTIAQ